MRVLSKWSFSLSRSIKIIFTTRRLHPTAPRTGRDYCDVIPNATEYTLHLLELLNSNSHIFSIISNSRMIWKWNNWNPLFFHRRHHNRGLPFRLSAGVRRYITVRGNMHYLQQVLTQQLSNLYKRLPVSNYIMTSQPQCRVLARTHLQFF